MAPQDSAGSKRLRNSAKIIDINIGVTRGKLMSCVNNERTGLMSIGHKKKLKLQEKVSIPNKKKTVSQLSNGIIYYWYI